MFIYLHLWTFAQILWLFVVLLDSYYSNLFNCVSICLNMLNFVWLCLTHAVMHKFCACFRYAKPILTLHKILHDICLLLAQSFATPAQFLCLFSFVLQISPATKHFLKIFFSKNDHEIEPVVLHTINSMNSTKWVTTFSWIFHFSLIDFSWEIFKIFY